MSSRYTIFSLIIHSIFYSFLYFYNDPKNILTTKTDFPPKIISINLVDITYNSNLKEKKKQSHNNKNKEPNTTKTDSSWNKTINKLNNEAIEKKSNQT
ncbi:MAG: hypothetical protein OEZ01_17750, partial [Candidatus Heimdallarchaeota archaeon]|nr:hypothetical protein [Candidatus Heimdallarchaeota archaeon]